MSDVDRASRIIKRAMLLMRLGMARGWSDALAKASKEIRV